MSVLWIVEAACPSPTAANIPVQAGDVFGSWTPGGLVNCANFVINGGSLFNAFVPDPSVGGTVSFTQMSPNFHLNLSANLVTAPTSKDQCKNNGWKDFPQFKNQGQCVSFVQSHSQT